MSGLAEIGVRSVDVTLKRRPVVLEADFELRTGVTALLGRNGAGKTTLMRVLAGVQPPTSGHVDVAGKSVYSSATAMKAHRSTLGWVPQGPGYPGSMRVRAFLEYAAWLKRVEPRQRFDSTQQALADCNIESLSDRTMKSLSGGERQRVVLAAAVVARPRVLLLDEPTSGLDPAQRESYLELVRGLGRTAVVLYASHIVDDVVRTCSRVLVLDCGRVSHDLGGVEIALPSEQLGEKLRQVVVGTRDRNG